MALNRAISFIGQIPTIGPEGDGDRDDYRAAPSSDRGNAGYDDAGMLGSYSSSREPFKTPDDVRMFAGYGATEADIERGYVEPAIREAPAYDLNNYKSRSSEPRVPDEDMGQTNVMEQDWQFRSRNMRSRGFLTRPRIPTERG